MMSEIATSSGPARAELVGQPRLQRFLRVPQNHPVAIFAIYTRPLLSLNSGHHTSCFARL